MSVPPNLALAGAGMGVSAVGDIIAQDGQEEAQRVQSAGDRITAAQRDTLSLQERARAEAQALINDKVSFEQQRATYEAQERAARLNASFAAYEAEGKRVAAGRTAELGAIEVEDIRADNTRALAAQDADLAGAGRDLSGGTALVLAFQSARQGERNVLKSKTQTMLDVEALEAEGDALDVQSSLYAGQADFARSQKIFSSSQITRTDKAIRKVAKDLKSGVRSLDKGLRQDLGKLRQKGSDTSRFMSVGAKLLKGSSKIAEAVI